MNNLKLTVAKATASSNGGFILTLVNKNAIDTPFGKKEQSITYYMKVAELGKDVKEGYAAEMDLDAMDIVTRDFEIPETPETKQAGTAGTVVPLKWLQLKPAA